MGDIAQRGNKLTKGVKDLVTGGYRGAKKVVQGAKDLITSPSKRIKKFGGGRTNLLEELGRVEGERSNPNRRAEISRVHGELNRGYKTGGRVGKLAGGVIKKVIQGGKKISKKISDAARKQDLADSMKRFEHAGPHEGEVITKRILGKGTKKGDRTKAAVKDAMEAKPWVGKPHAAGGRIGKAVGGSIKKIAKTAAKRWKKKKVYPETEDLTHQVGPYVGDVGSERPGIKRREWGKRPGQKKPDRKHIPYERQPAKKGGKADKNWIQKAVNPKHKGYCTPMTKKTCTPARKALARTFKKKAKTGW